MAVNGLGIKYDPYQYFKKAQAEKTEKNDGEKPDSVPQKETGELSKTENKAGELKFNNKDELMSYLKQNYKIVAKGMTQISGSYLNRCLKIGRAHV